jgi:RNA polymerase-binding transcription factor DksA
MRVIILRKQDMADELPEEVQEEARQTLVEKIRQLLNEVETNLEGMSFEELKELLGRLGGGQKLLRKGEVTIIPESVLEALDNLVEAVGELASKFPALGEEEAEELLGVVEKIETNLNEINKQLQEIKKQLQEGTVVIEEELKKQLEEGPDSPEGVVEQDPIDRIEILVPRLMSAMALLKNELKDIEHNLELLSNPEERSVFVKRGWFERKIRSIDNRLHEIKEIGSELLSHLQTLGGGEARRLWKR